VSLTRLWLRVAPSGAVEWLCRDGQGRLVLGPGHCAPGVEQVWPRVDQTIVVWADQSLVFRRVALPSSGRAKWRTGIAYLAEDWVAGDVGDLHVVAPANLVGRETWVSVVERRRLNELIEQLRTLGLKPDRIIPEAAFLGPGRAADVLLDAGNASFCSASGIAGGCEAEMLEIMVGEPLDSVRVLATADVELEGAHADRIDSVLRWLSLQPIDDTQIDLLQGSYAPPDRDRVGGGWWRLAALAAVVAVAVHTLTLAIEVYSLKRTEQQLSAELEGKFREVFGASERMVDPAFQIRSAYARLGGPGVTRSEALALLKGIAPLLVADSRLVLEGFVYADGALEVAVRAPDATRFEGLREQFLLNPQLQVEIGSTSYEGKEVIGRLRIRRQA
jgi:type II secretion system protein L